MACDVGIDEPLSSTCCLPVCSDILEDIEVPKLGVGWIGFTTCCALLKGLELAVEEVGG